MPFYVPVPVHARTNAVPRKRALQARTAVIARGTHVEPIVLHHERAIEVV